MVMRSGAQTRRPLRLSALAAVVLACLSALLPWLLIGPAEATTHAGSIDTHAAASAESSQQPGRVAYDDVAKTLDEQGVPGWAVAVVTKDGVLHQQVAGTTTDGEPTRATTPFLIGSVSKTLTATVVMKLVEHGRLNLDRPAATYLPAFHLAGDRGRDITVRQLLNHTSGLSAADGLSRADQVDGPEALHRLVGSLREAEPLHRPGEKHVYSSANYLVLGALVEKVTGQPFATALSSSLLAPLGMTHTVSTTQQADAAHLQAGHRYIFGRTTGLDRGYTASGVPYGYVGSTLDDMTRYARFQLGAGPADVLRPESMAAMQSRSVQTSAADRFYGLGWSGGAVDGIPGTVVEHTGSTPGSFAHVVLLPAKGIAVIVLANAASEAKAPILANVGHNLLRVSVGASPQSAEADPVLSAAPWVALALALIGIAVLGLQLWRLRKGHRGRTVTRVLITAGFLLLAVVLWQIPAYVGASWSTLRLFAPDLAWSLIAAVALWVAVALVSLSRLIPRGSTARVMTPTGQRGLGGTQ